MLKKGDTSMSASAPKFKFAHTVINIDAKDSGYTATSVLVDGAADPFFTAVGSSMFWGVKTHLSMKYKPGTMLMDSVDVSVEDNRIKYIDAAAGIVGSLIKGGSAPPTPGPIQFPISIAVDQFLSASIPTVCQESDDVRVCQYDGPAGSETPQWRISITFYPPSPGAISFSEFAANHLGSNETAVFYSSCREAMVRFSPIGAQAESNLGMNEIGMSKRDETIPTLSRAPELYRNSAMLKVAANTPKPIDNPPPPMAPIMPSRPAVSRASMSMTVRVADPNFLESTMLPDKGTVSLRSDCGAEVTSQPAGTSSGWEVAADVIKQAKSAYDASHTKPAK
ncbi:hypothetical protein [Paraburkholderia caballeronis]|nr:hypothetical protein [Paraburkholderia caballeronis]